MYLTADNEVSYRGNEAHLGNVGWQETVIISRLLNFIVPLAIVLLLPAYYRSLAIRFILF